MRSRAAAQMLQNAGFQDVHSLRGGIRAWNGLTAAGEPEADLDRFYRAAGPQEQVAIAWLLEEGTRLFYAELARTLPDSRVSGVFAELAEAEQGHKRMLRMVFEGLAGRPAPARFPDGVLTAAEREPSCMEGGMKVADAIAWSRGRSLADILDLGIAVETNALDRYLILRRSLPDENARRAFEVLSDEERRHLKRLSAMIEGLP